MNLPAPRVTVRDCAQVNRVLEAMDVLSERHMLCERAFVTKLPVWFSRFSFQHISSWVAYFFECRILHHYEHIKQEAMPESFLQY